MTDNILSNALNYIKNNNKGDSKVFENKHKNIDPYDEEEWDEDYKIGDYLICQVDYTVGYYPPTHVFKKGKSYEIVDVGDDKMYIMSETGRGKWEKKDCSEFKKTPPPNLRNIVPVHYNQRYYDI